MKRISIINNSSITMAECCEYIKQLHNKGLPKPGLYNTIEVDRFNRVIVDVTMNEKSMRFEIYDRKK